MAIHISTTDTAKLIRRILKAKYGKRFKGVKFSVTCDSYAGGSSMDIRWMDGPIASSSDPEVTDTVDDVVRPFVGSTFDSMIDLKSYVHATWRREWSKHTKGLKDFPAVSAGDEVSFGPDHIFTNRSVGVELMQHALTEVCAIYDESPANYQVFQKHSNWNAAVETVEGVADEYRFESFRAGVPAHYGNLMTMQQVVHAYASKRTKYDLLPELKNRAQRTATPEVISTPGLTVDIVENEEKNGVELHFSSKPNEAIRTSMKANGFSCARRNRKYYWYVTRSEATLTYARNIQEIVAGSTPSTTEVTTISTPEPVAQPVTQSSRLASAADRLEGLAENMQSKIDNAFAERQENTARRRNMAASVRADGRKMIEIQCALRAMAWAIGRNEMPEILEGSLTKKAVTELIQHIASIKGSTNERYRFRVVEYCRDTEPQREALIPLMERYRNGDDSVDDNTGNLAIAAELEARAGLLEMASRGIDGFWPTPDSAADDVAGQADLHSPDLTVLDCSAGHGSLLSAAQRKGIKTENLFAVERNYSLREYLKNSTPFTLLGYDSMCITSLAHDGNSISTCDRLLLNPAFENNHAPKEVQHAVNYYLKPDGLCVAILPASCYNGQRLQWFRDWVDSQGGTIEMQEQGVFNRRDSLRKTQASTCVAVIPGPEYTPSNSQTTQNAPKATPETALKTVSLAPQKVSPKVACDVQLSIASFL